MNVDILRKLIELACNNSNEHEANSAARRVCRMIKDDNFNVFNHSNSIPHQRPVSPTGRYTTDLDDLMRDIQRRAAEASARERERARDIFERAKEREREKKEQARKQNEERKRKEKEEPKFTKKEERKPWNWGYSYDEESPVPPFVFDSATSAYDNFKKANRPSLERTCTKCGVKVKTYRIKDEPYICGVCQWGDYTKEKEL